MRLTIPGGIVGSIVRTQIQNKSIWLVEGNSHAVVGGLKLDIRTQRMYRAVTQLTLGSKYVASKTNKLSR